MLRALMIALDLEPISSEDEEDDLLIGSDSVQ
jgi:hypothetical protein